LRSAAERLSMGRGRDWMAWGAAILALNLAWEVSIYLSRAWPIYHPFIGMALGALLVVVGLIVSAVGWLRHAEQPSSEAERGRR
jgi:hypothetical protein